jgi:hypothetical protein
MLRQPFTAADESRDPDMVEAGQELPLFAEAQQHVGIEPAST